jgi:thiol-disulfide isomerase/thioredoxin
MQVVAHFGASWCVTSLSMNYKFEELAQAHPEVLFLSVDVDDVQVNTILLILCPAFSFSINR